MKKLKYWIPTLIMLIFIWGNSMLNGTISEYLSSFIHMLLSGREQADIIAHGYDAILRKLAHFSEYFMLCVTVIYGFRKTLKDATLYQKYTWVFLAVAPIDETIQLFVADRSGSFKDVLIDWSGFILAYALINVAIAHYARYKKVHHLNG